MQEAELRFAQSKRADVVYEALWFNTQSRRLRWTGPAKHRPSVFIAPPDGGNARKRTKEESPWVLVRVCVSRPEWTEENGWQADAATQKINTMRLEDIEP